LKQHKSESTNVVIDDIQGYFSNDFIEVERKLLNDEIHKKLNAAIQNLPPKRRMVFKLVKDENFSYRETANLLSISERTVEVHLKLAIKDLRVVLQEIYGEYKGMELSGHNFV